MTEGDKKLYGGNKKTYCTHHEKQDSAVRHPELVSGSLAPPVNITAKIFGWMLIFVAYPPTKKEQKILWSQQKPPQKIEGEKSF